jgi:hypothetical protein
MWNSMPLNTNEIRNNDYFCGMTKVVLVILAAGSIMFYGSACKKKEANDGSNIDTEKTAITNKGRFVCVVNGKEWLSDAATKKYVVKYQDPNISFNQDIYGAEGTIFGDTLNLSGAKVSGVDSSAVAFEIVLKSGYHGTYTIGNYPPKNAGKASAYFYNKLGKAGYDIGNKSYNVSGNLSITNFNDSNQICSGTFEINMVPKNASDPKTPAYTLTKGVFYDVKFN